MVTLRSSAPRKERISAPYFRSRARNASPKAKALTGIFAAALVAGCQGNPAAELTAAVAPVATETRRAELFELARYGNAVRELDSRQLEQQYRELALTNGAFLSSDEVIKLSLLLSAPNAPFHDVDQATRFLRDVVQRDAAAQPEQTELAKLLYNLLSERIYPAPDDGSMQALLMQARDRNEELSAELAEIRAELAAERERTETLEGQLNALKELEEQLSLEDVGR